MALFVIKVIEDVGRVVLNWTYKSLIGCFCRKRKEMTLLRGPAQNAWKWRPIPPDRFQSSVISLAFLQPQQSFCVVDLYRLNMFNVHLDMVQFFSSGCELWIHARTSFVTQVRVRQERSPVPQKFPSNLNTQR